MKNRKTVDLINSPPHYNSGEAHCKKCNESIECIDVSKFYCFRLGNVIKYIWRHKHKDGLTALKKAKWYLDSVIEDLENGINKK